MQPYFFPYLGHFALISRCDKWVVFDITQFTPKTWISRNRILHPNVGWNYISVPLSNASISISILETKILSFHDLSRSVFGKISHYRRRAPYYAQVKALLQEVFSVETDSLVEFNVRALVAVCRYLGISFDYLRASDLDLPLPKITHPGAWAPAISHVLCATDYINPIGGRAIFRQEDFDTAKVNLQFLEFSSWRYNTDTYTFQEALSILDVMMWSLPETIREAIEIHGRVINAGDISRDVISIESTHG